LQTCGLFIRTGKTSFTNNTVKKGTDNIHWQSGAIQKAAVTLESISQKVAQQTVEVNTASGRITAHLESAKELGFTG
jgi:hypothetical protein